MPQPVTAGTFVGSSQASSMPLPSASPSQTATRSPPWAMHNVSVASTTQVPSGRQQLTSSTSVVQVAEQPSPLALLPSSHCSPACTIPSPQKVQLLRQVSVSLLLPSSQVSPAEASVTPSPQQLQSGRQLSQAVLPRSVPSQVSFGPRMLSPQTRMVQSLRQALSSLLSPSSHCS